ncbi:hypothetical protein K8R42_03460 [bacterium]|nr:hypothetical protein [bacterium]
MKSFLAIVSVLVMTGVVVGVVAIAADTASVTATVTARNVSVSVTDGSVLYGNLTVGGTNSTTSDGIDDTQQATNDGNVSATLNIIGTDSGDWTLESAAGADQYTHAFCNTDTCDATPTWTLMQEVAYTTMSSTTVATSTGYQNVDLRINLPSSSSVYTEQTVSVTVQAVSSY